MENHFKIRPLTAQFVPDSRQAWIRLGIALLIGSVGSVGMWSVVVALPAVQSEFGASRGGASLAFTLTMAGFGIGGVAAGRLTDRVGIVATVALAAFLMGLGYLAASQSMALWQFNLICIAMGAGSSATFGPLMAEASHWFERRRGIAVSIAATGSYIGGAFWPPLVNWGIQTHGWRFTHAAIGLVSCALMLVLLIVLRMQMGAGSRRSHVNALPPRIDLQLGSNALTTLLFVAGVACCVAMAMPQVHIVAYCGDLGYGAARGSEMLSLMLACGIISRVGSGFLADRIGGIRTLLLGSVMQGIALLFYLFFDSMASLYAISAMFGLFQGGIVPGYAIIIREAMPASEAATRVGIVILGTVVGMALGGWISGLIFDATGSYAAAFMNGLGWNALNVVIMVSLLWRARQRLALAA
ncbi:MFS transporter [Tardiphaga sp.]|uniref:MFS transporter n=1 Tax=Tardiphaga sp. TaxID=1926292 RepID=UPI00261B0CD7|nr:MFS transporter [Tardiphaga sp.]MDB5618338.1 major facilitator superfamily 1 [Tardiphaga sp.]